MGNLLIYRKYQDEFIFNNQLYFYFKEKSYRRIFLLKNIEKTLEKNFILDLLLKKSI